MIVKCDQCQTRFKIPDEKVTEKGVKVRCTKCQHTFRVKRAPDPAAAAPAPSDDPFAQFGPPETAESAQSRSNVFGEGDPSVFDQPTRVGPLPASFEAARRAAMADLGQSSSGADPFALGEAPPGPTRPGVADPFADSALTARTSIRAPQQRPQPADDPFADALGGEGGATQPQGRAHGADPFADSFPDSSAALTQPRGKPAGSDPFLDSLAGDGRTQPAMRRPNLAEAAPPEPDPFAAAMGEAPPAADLEFDVTGMRRRPEPPPGMSALDTPEHGGAREQFPDLAPPSGEVSQAGDGDRNSLFDMPAAAPSLPPPDPEDFDGAPLAPQGAPSAALGRLKLEKVPAGQANQAGGSKPTLTGEFPAPKPRRQRGLVGNLVAAGLVTVVLVGVGSVFLNEGKLDGQTFSFENFRALFLPPGDFVAVDVSNGLYETRSGRPVFFVRGEVTNRGSQSSKVSVRADILEDAQLVRSLEVAAGASPTPEELYQLGGADAVMSLQAKLNAAAVEVKPGARVPFLIAFYEYPPDLSSFRLKVTVTPTPAGQAQR